MNDLAASPAGATSAAAIAAVTSAPPAPMAAPEPAAASPPSSAVEAPAAPASPASATPAAPESAPPAAEARPAHEFQDSILDDGGVPKEPPAQAKDAPKDSAQPDTTSPEKGDPPQQSAEPIVYAFEYPEGFHAENLNSERMTEFTSLLNENRVPKERAQRLMDMHLENVQMAQIRALDDVWQTYHKQQDAWKDELRKDSEFGGDKLSDTRARALATIKQYGGSRDEQTALLQELRITGAANSPRFVKLLARIGETHTREGTPVVVPPPRQQPMNKQQRGLARYQGSSTPGST